MTLQSSDTSNRGPADHAVRDQIVSAAREHFTHYGYGKTTVSDLAREIGFSKAYIYRFFDSKQAIGEAICGERLALLLGQARTSVERRESATEKLRVFFRSLTELTAQLLFDDRKIYEIAALSTTERWGSSQNYHAGLRETVASILREGRENGEFERKTPIDEACRAILYTMMPFVDPLHLERNFDLLPDAQIEVTGLILRSLAP